MKLPRHGTVVAYVALFFAMGGTAMAATGGTFLLGKSNSATATTSLSNSAGTALSLSSKSGTAPLSVNKNKTKVGYLNSDLLDGLDSTAFAPASQTFKSVVADIPTTGEFAGVGAATCAKGYVAVAGSFESAWDPSNGTPAPVMVYEGPTTGDDGSDGYAVVLVNTDGGPYTGGGTVSSRCLPGKVTGTQISDARRANNRTQSIAARAVEHNAHS
jgi:hypothetical protein